MNATLVALPQNSESNNTLHKLVITVYILKLHLQVTAAVLLLSFSVIISNITLDFSAY